MAEVKEKEYPENYPEDVIRILDAMAFDPKEVRMLGSMSIRSQQYAGDYDAFERVSIDSLSETVKKFQSIIRHLLSLRPKVYIGDIKSGIVPQWEVLKGVKLVDGGVVGYNRKESRDKIYLMLEKKVISAQEAEKAYRLLPTLLTPKTFLEAKDFFKFHTIRWTIPEILHNKNVLRDGTAVSLEECFVSPGITKVDVIALVQNSRFTDFSAVYEFVKDGKVVNDVPFNLEESLKQDIQAYTLLGKPFKSIKRMFALAKHRDDNETIKALTPILNSDLGRLYHIIGDIGTLIALLEDHKQIPITTIHYEIDQFINRLAHVYTLKDFLKAEPNIVREIKAMLKLTGEPLRKGLQRLQDSLNGFLQHNTAIVLKTLHPNAF